VEQFVKETSLPFPAGMDSDDSLSIDYGVQTVPHMAFLNAQGKIIYTRGFTYSADAGKILDAVLKGETIDTSDMPSQPG